jgi:molybdenum cofactor cytidylyltransferase
LEHNPEVLVLSMKIRAMDKIGTVLLAAGSSSRLGQSKQMVDYHGKSLLEHAVTEITGSKNDKLMVVLGYEPEAHRSLIEKYDLNIVVNSHWEKGMGSSLKFGLKNLLNLCPDLKAVMITVCDQPSMKSKHIDLLIDSYYSGNQLVASGYKKTFGVPVLFDCRYFDELAMIMDNEGARSVVEKHRDDLIQIQLEKGEIDLDTPEDLNLDY